MIIAVVDDTMQDRELLKGMLDQYFSGHQTVPEIQEFESGEAFLEAYEPGHYDIIFFDIYMGGITGMETASLVYERDKDCRLVFFSSSADYAVDSYRVRAAYYLMKPLSYEDLALALDCFTRELLEAGREWRLWCPLVNCCTWTALNVWCGYIPAIPYWRLRSPLWLCPGG